VALITLVPGLATLRSRFAHGNAGWLTLGAGLKVLSAFSYVAVFRSVFCRRMSWRLSTEIGLSELGANAVIPTGGAGGLAHQRSHRQLPRAQRVHDVGPDEAGPAGDEDRHEPSKFCQ